MSKYRKKASVVVDVVQWRGEDIVELLSKNNVSWLAQALADRTIKYVPDAWWGRVRRLEIKTREGVMKATVGDYIIRGVKGELYPCKPDIFAETYEDAE